MARTNPNGRAAKRPNRRTTPNAKGLESLGSLIDSESTSEEGPSQTRGKAPPQDEPSAAGNSSPGNLGGLEALGNEMNRSSRSAQQSSRRSSQKSSRRRRRAKRIVLSLIAVIVLVVSATAGYAWYLNHEIHRIDVRGLTGVPTTGADAGTENILMVGSTDRCVLTVQNPAYGLCSQGVTGINSDVVMILHLDPAKHSLSILSIPRDVFIPNARTTGAYKIDAALYQGPDQLIAAIKEDFGIPIQHYVVLNFDTFANVVNALGGVHMYFPEPVYDAYSGLNQPVTGCVFLNGIQALQVVRARHIQYMGPGVTTTNHNYWPYENQSDLARIRRDHEFLRVLASAMQKKGLSNPVTDEQLVSSVAPQLTTDSTFSAHDMLNLVLDFHTVNVSSAPQVTLPVEVDNFGNYIYQGSSYGDIEFPAEPQDHQVIDQFLGISATTDTMQGGQLPLPSSVSVSVVNGTGAAGQASKTASALQSLGFNVAGTGNTPSVAAESETIVYYSQSTSADEAAAQTTANSLSGAVIMAQGPTTDGAQVTVVTGSQFSVNSPASSSTTTSASQTQPTTSTTAAASSGAFSTPTSSSSPLQPWDPRSCTATGGEGP